MGETDGRQAAQARSMPGPSSPGRAFDRALWSVGLLIALSVLLAARWLTPDASGTGTHEQLGLPPCGMLAWLGIPCPACGLTTSFAHLADGQLLAALSVHPLGLPLFLATCLAVPGALVALWRGTSISWAIDRLQADRAALYFVVAALVVWIVRLAAW